MRKRISYYTFEDVMSAIESKIKSLETEKRNNYQIESYYTDIESKISILKEILNQFE
jgi:hypothetical protein